jgi:gamma-glutamyltranspeptidase/glutathione hydrolase
MARLADGRTLVYGTMGGEGQPQTQAALYTRHVLYGQELQTAVTAPRFLLGRTWGATSTNLKLEGRVDPAVIQALRQAGHDVEVVADFTDAMGHAGAIARHPSGLLEGAADPRGDGVVAAF